MSVSWYQCNHSQTILLAGTLCHTFPKPALQLLHSFLSFGVWILLGYPCLTETTISKFNTTWSVISLLCPWFLNVHFQSTQWKFLSVLRLLGEDLQSGTKKTCKIRIDVNNWKTSLVPTWLTCKYRIFVLSKTIKITLVF
jgi:hypothetical protein